MSGYNISLSGLKAAQRAFDVIGNNIANAATEGYHRQRLELSPAFSIQPGATTFMGGVNIEGITRIIDSLLEDEILRQQSAQGSISQQTSVMRTIESAFGEFASENGGLSAALDAFFMSLQNLSSHPGENIWQNQVVSDAESMVNQFNTLGNFLNTLKSQVQLEAQNTVNTINLLVTQIADLNSQIERIAMMGGSTGSITDHRDQFISTLSELIGIQTVNQANGVVNISSGGVALVTGSMNSTLEAGLGDNGKLGLSIAAAQIYDTAIQGGKMGGLCTLNNEIISGVQEDLDLLANAIMQQVNRFQVMGIGSFGSFSSLTGTTNVSQDLSSIGDITPGTFYIRVTDGGTHTVTRHAITIEAGNTLTDIAASLSAIAGLTASVTSSHQLVISAEAGYTFDFLPSVLPEPTRLDFEDVSPPSVSVFGIYTGTEDDTFEFTVKGDGAVGNGTLALDVRNSSGTLIKTLNIGAGYAVGDRLNIGNGITISLSLGNLSETQGDVFEVDAFVQTDTSGFLQAVGLNTFFSGTSAATMAVTRDISENPHRVATSLGSDATDNTNVLRMADIKDMAIGSLRSLTPGDFYHQLTVNLGQKLSIQQMQQENNEAVILNLVNQRSITSGVNINDESAQLLVFEQMFQAMAKYLSILDRSVASLMDMI
jgi:flagellar hook-associated protein 1